ncbi:MAG: flagellar basal body rod protein FlgC [Verrucomicrobia bacterium]|nr:flagellar basal body rod protein FlgC [Verrucomicrobiota bacterium]
MGNGSFSSFDISASGMTAERLRMNVIAENIANREVTRTPEGGAYKRKVVVFEEALANATLRLDGLMGDLGAGVRVADIVPARDAVHMVHNPGHPDADENGYVEMPNVNMIDEMLNMMTATRGYEANVMAISAAKQMILKALEI